MEKTSVRPVVITLPSNSNYSCNLVSSSHDSKLHKIENASLLYRLILFKFPEYVDAYLRLAAIAKARNNVPLSIELIRDALEVDDKNMDALCMLGDLELKKDDWVKAKDLT